MTRDLIALPKAHLHLHLAQSIRHDTAAEWASVDGVAPAAIGGFEDFDEFLRASDRNMSLVSSADRVGRLIDEVVEDAALDGVRILEIAFSVGGYSQVFGGDAPAVEAIASLISDAGIRHGVWARAIVGIDRHNGPERALATAQLAAQYAENGVVGLGMHGDERSFAVADFAPAFQIGRDAGLLSVPHAGELMGADAVRDAMYLLHADRIQHGIAAADDPALLAELAERQICLDVCPTSNLELGVVRRLALHPLPALLGAGVPCSVNADDPALFGVGAADEYELCRREMKISDSGLAAVARNSIRSSAAPTSITEPLLRSVDAWLS